jgi:hypothetical protein
MGVLPVPPVVRLPTHTTGDVVRAIAQRGDAAEQQREHVQRRESQAAASEHVFRSHGGIL